MAFGNKDQRRICEIHRPIAISSHKGVECWKIFHGNWGKGDCAGTNELPCRIDFSMVVSNQVKHLGEHRFRSQEGKTELLVSRDTRVVPTVVSIQQRQYGACIDESVSGHDAVAAAFG